MTDSLKIKCKMIAKYYGSSHQAVKAIEEMAELQKELAKYALNDNYNMKNIMECWFSDWRGQETHGDKTRVMIHCDVKHRYKDRDKREPYVFNTETNEPNFPYWCPVEWRESNA